MILMVRVRNRFEIEEIVVFLFSDASDVTPLVIFCLPGLIGGVTYALDFMCSHEALLRSQAPTS